MPAAPDVGGGICSWRALVLRLGERSAEFAGKVEAEEQIVRAHPCLAILSPCNSCVATRWRAMLLGVACPLELAPWVPPWGAGVDCVCAHAQLGWHQRRPPACECPPSLHAMSHPSSSAPPSPLRALRPSYMPLQSLGVVPMSAWSLRPGGPCCCGAAADAVHGGATQQSPLLCHTGGCQGWALGWDT